MRRKVIDMKKVPDIKFDPDSPVRIHTEINIRPVPMQAQYQRPDEMFTPRGIQMQPNTFTQLISAATIRPIHKHL